MHNRLSGEVSRFFFFLVFSFLAATGLAFASSEPEWAPLPDWVSDIAIPAPVPDQIEQISGGIYFLLWSNQARFDGKTRVEYRRSVRQIVSRSGLESTSSVSVSFRPGIETLRLHRLAIHRNGRIIDLTGKVDFEVFRRERELPDGILNGRLTAFANLPQVRVGDIVEISFSRRYSTVLMSNHFFDAYQETDGDPAAQVETVVKVPEALDLQYKIHGVSMQSEIETSNGVTTYRWLRGPVPPVEPTKSRPDWYASYDFVEVSSISSWADIAAATLGHYPDSVPLPAAMQDDLAVIRSRSGDRKIP